MNGNFPPVINWKQRVPTPEVNKAMLGSKSAKIGTNTKAPKEICEGVSLYLEKRLLNPDSLEKVVDRGILGCLKPS